MTVNQPTLIETCNLSISGMSCASCVKKVEATLKGVAGVERVTVNFADRSALVEGSPNPDDLISTIASAGYSAQILSDDVEDMDEKERVEQAYYKQLLFKTAVALAVGLPLMLYGMLIGDMTINTGGERIFWFLTGLVTLTVMMFAGGHFYTGAWKSF